MQKVYNTAEKLSGLLFDGMFVAEVLGYGIPELLLKQLKMLEPKI